MLISWRYRWALLKIYTLLSINIHEMPSDPTPYLLS